MAIVEKALTWNNQKTPLAFYVSESEGLFQAKISSLSCSKLVEVVEMVTQIPIHPHLLQVWIE